MPLRDRMGPPWGSGPMTGRGMGYRDSVSNNGHGEIKNKAVKNLAIGQVPAREKTKSVALLAGLGILAGWFWWSTRERQARRYIMAKEPVRRRR